ncbi:MAG: NAD(P)-dependent glycerol-1-phosphate dehydrogenase [Euryarchaeota archaeon]|nr:NAD(P)-dependent glycerol-1-phosphate dehydrogenase [Euryarchaeota archaeon]
MDSFQKSKLMVFPRSVLIGHGVISEVATLSQDLELGETVLVASGPKTFKLAGESVGKHLEKGDYKVHHAPVEKATMKEVDKTVAAAEAKGCEAIFGVGGGTVVDVAKLAAYRLKVPFVSVPTSPAHDGLASGRASVSDAEEKKSMEATSPLGILADTAVIQKAPYRFLASGCADILSNTTAVLDWQLAERLRGEEYSSFAAVLSKTAAELILNNADAIKPGLEESSWFVMKSLITSGVAMSVAGTSRPASGAEHMFSHQLDRLAPGRALHGEQCGIGTILTMYLHGGDWQKIRDTLKKVGAPTTAKELGIPKKKIIQALCTAHEVRPERYTILGDKGLTPQAAAKLAKETGVVGGIL